MKIGRIAPLMYTPGNLEYFSTGAFWRASPTITIPEIHPCVKDFAARLDLKKDVDVYIIEANVTNAAAVKYGKKNVVILTDDLIHGCLASGHPKALAFVIGHELAHITPFLSGYKAASALLFNDSS